MISSRTESENNFDSVIDNRSSFRRGSCKMDYKYHFGIIDYLQEYSLEKKIERFVKSFYAGDDMSVASPEKYF